METETIRELCRFSTNAFATVVHNYSPINEIFSFDSNSHVLPIAPGKNQTPQVIQEGNVEYKAFPTLLPSGKFGWHFTRKVPLSPSQYFGFRLLHLSGQFAKLPDFVFFAPNVVQRDRIKNGLTTALLQSPSTGKITASKALDLNDVRNLAQRQKYFRFMASVPGTPAYWQTFSYEVSAVIRQNGVPQFWHTVTCAELEWTDLLRILSRKYWKKDLTHKGIKKMTYLKKCELLNCDPATVARHFQNRLELYFKAVLNSSINNLGGKILYYAIKIEFQMRGSPHAHMLIWVSPHVKLTEQTVPISIEYIDKIVNVDIPDKKTSAELAKKCHTHRHTKTGKKRNTFCRFNFPKFPTTETIISNPLPPEMLQNEKETHHEKRDESLEKVMKEVLKLKTENEKNISIEKLLLNAQE